jgi:RHS repeat-associated protein
MPTTTKYIWEDDNYLAEADGNDTINVVYTNEPQQYGNFVSTRISTTSSYHHFDAIGSTRQLTNAANSITDRAIYDAWGNLVSRSGTTGVMLLWIGEIQYYSDSETGFVWVQIRAYGPKIARWTTVDPVIDRLFLNRLAYTKNQPASLHDASGKQPVWAGNPSIVPSGVEPYLVAFFVPDPRPPRFPRLPHPNPTARGGCVVAVHYINGNYLCDAGFQPVPYIENGLVWFIWCIQCDSSIRDPCRVTDFKNPSWRICDGECVAEIDDVDPFPPFPSCRCAVPQRNPQLV